jgi:hypothetical protein
VAQHDHYGSGSSRDRAILPGSYLRTEEVTYREPPRESAPRVIAGEAVPDDFEMEPPGSRVGDKQRDRVVDHLTTMHGRGVITPEELERRRDYVMAATRISQLAMVTSDLPRLPLERGPLYNAAEAKFTWPGWVQAAAKQVKAPLGNNLARMTAGWLTSLAFLTLPMIIFVVPFRKPAPGNLAVAVPLTVIGAAGVIGMLVWTFAEAKECFDTHQRRR